MTVFAAALLLACELVAAPAKGAPNQETRAHSGSLPLSRLEVIRRAADQNPQVAAARSDILRAQAQAGRVEAARHPEITVLSFISTALRAETVGAHSPQSTRSVYSLRLEDLTAAFGTSITLTQPLYTFGKIDLRQEATEHAERAGEATTKMTQADVALEAVKLYETHLMAREALVFLDEIEAYTQKAIDEAETHLEDHDPDASEEDVLRLKTGLAILRMGRHQAEAGLEQTREGLRAYLNLEDDAVLAPSETAFAPLTMPTPTPGPTPTGAPIGASTSTTAPTSGSNANEKASAPPHLVALAFERRPELKALRHGIAGYEKLAQAIEADYYPDIFLYGILSGAYTPGREYQTSRYVFDPLAHFLPAALIGARWTLRWDAPTHEAAEVRADVARLAGLLEWANHGIPAELNKAYQDADRARRDLSELDRTLPLTKQWAVRASADYGIGLGTSRSIADAATAYVQMKVASLDAVYRLNVALAELAKATGTLTDGEGTIYPGSHSP
ncbi:MAG: TolC family protein [Deltaproteobacteria bacterium]|nr:TolC family protein [Deltaproteobacteria bacterium]